MENIRQSEGAKRRAIMQEENFINIFVNAVYGILLGYGFSSSIHDLYYEHANTDTLLYYSFAEHSFEYSLILFAIVVLCVFWWDWRLNVGRYVKTHILEFTINILILLNLEWLFFEFYSFLNFSFLMATLAFLNLIWVVHFRINRYKESNLSFRDYIQNRIVVDHIAKRLFGVILYTALFIVYLIVNEKKMGDRDLDEWLGLLILAAIFIFDRVVLYGKRRVFVKGEIQTI